MPGRARLIAARTNAETPVPRNAPALTGKMTLLSVWRYGSFGSDCSCGWVSAAAPCQVAGVHSPPTTEWTGGSINSSSRPAQMKLPESSFANPELIRRYNCG